MTTYILIFIGVKLNSIFDKRNAHSSLETRTCIYCTSLSRRVWGPISKLSSNVC